MMLIDRRYFCYFDWISFLIMVLLCAVGLLFIFSATTQPELPFSLFFKKQLLGVVSGLVIYSTLCALDYRILWRAGYLLYFVVILLLLFTFVKGSLIMGAQRWISLGLIRFQPSEIAKLFFPAFFSYYFWQETKTSRTVHDFIPVIGVLLFSTLLILKQPDLGTALVLLFSGTMLLWFMGLHKKYFILVGITMIMSLPLGWKLLKPYQRQRIAVFFGQGDARKERYQIEQSIIAIGSGGFAGKGFLCGTQNKFLFLPESRTDFIFSVVSEEGGFIITLTLILLYLLLFLRLLWLITTIPDFFARILALGLILHIMISSFINIGMVTGLLPTVGIPLPFISYGMSNLWVTCASMGWFQSIVMRRFQR